MASAIDGAPKILGGFPKPNFPSATNQSQSAEKLHTIKENKEHIRIWKFFTTEQVDIFNSKITG